jgi:hypothetical protein
MQSARVKKGGRSRLLDSTAAASLEAMVRLVAQYPRSGIEQFASLRALLREQFE